MFDNFEDVNERSNWRRALPAEIKAFAERNKIRGNKISNLSMSFDIILSMLGQNSRYQKAREMATQIRRSIDEVMTEQPDPKDPEAKPVQPYNVYSLEEQVAFVRKLDLALRAFVAELEVK
jgi:hypothetical protein